MQEADERAWLERCARGEASACAELVARYGRMVGTIILRTTGRHAEVEDLTQEAFLRVFRHLPEFEGRAKLSTWICTVAQRVALDELRRTGRRPVLADLDTAAEPAAPDDPAADAEQRQRDQLVRQALDSLPEKYRLPLLYVAIEGVDYQTLSTLLAMPVGTVKTNVFRGKQLLRERLEALAPGGHTDGH